MSIDAARAPPSTGTARVTAHCPAAPSFAAGHGPTNLPRRCPHPGAVPCPPAAEACWCPSCVAAPRGHPPRSRPPAAGTWTRARRLATPAVRGGGFVGRVRSHTSGQLDNPSAALETAAVHPPGRVPHSTAPPRSSGQSLFSQSRQVEGALISSSLPSRLCHVTSPLSPTLSPWWLPRLPTPWPSPSPPSSQTPRARCSCSAPPPAVV